MRIRDCKGLSVVAHLVGNPGCRFRSRDLLGLMTPRPQPLAKRKFDRRGHALGNDYRRRLVNLRDALRRARAFDDSQAAAEIERQMAVLTRELAQAVGLGDAKRGEDLDTDRVINRAITSAIANISHASRGLARHLRKTITADPVFSYIPE